MKLGLQIVLGILSLIPVFFGVTGLLYGAEQLMPEGQSVPPALDNQFRYWAGFYFVLAFLLWWAIPNIERHTTLLRIVCLALVIGGVGRLVSHLTVGPGGPDQFGAMILEIGSVVFVFWQAMLPKEEAGVAA
jgi:hypothetical protein